MKKLKNLLFLSLLFFFGSLQAQVSEKEVTMSLGNQNAMIIELKESDRKIAENVWKEFIKEYGKVKKNKKANEFYMEQTNIPAVSGNSAVDVYTRFEEGADMVKAHFWFDTGGSFLSSDNDSDGYQGANTLLTEYGYAVQKHIIGKELETEQKKLKGFQKDMDKLVKENKSLHKEIKDAQEKIRKAEINIEKNVVAQENKTTEIESQAEKVKAVEEKLNNVGKGGSGDK